MEVEGQSSESPAGSSPFPSGMPGNMDPSDLLALNLDSRQITLLTAGVSALLASHITLNVVSEHLKHWKRSREQRAICVILFMIPLFAIDAYLGLADMPGSEIVITVLESIRSCYEAYVVSEFLILLFSYMDISTKSDAPVPDTVKGKVLHNSFPLTLFLGKDMLVDRKSINTLYALSRQFVIVRPVFSVLQCVLILVGVYHVSLVPWLFMLVFNISVYLAFYSLLLFYHAFEHQLEKHNPLVKFLSVKGVVFVIFWQELLIKLLVAYDVIHAGHMPFQVRQVEEAVQNFLVCVEMLLAALLFRYAFSASEYEHLSSQPPDEGAKKSANKGSKKVAPSNEPSKTSTTQDTKKDK